MSSFVTDQGIIHYETYGRGRPVLLLHGWLGSWYLWRDTIEVLGKEFRTYALDFWGFGESAGGTNNYTVDNFVELVYQFMDKLGIVKAPLIGHSMGGTVALSTAMRYPEKVVKVAVVGSPINGTSLNLLLKASGYPAVASIFWVSPRLLKTFLSGYSYFMARDGRSMSQMITRDMSQVTMQSFFQSIGTLRKTDLRPRLGEVHVPTLGIYGKRDIIVDPRQGEVLKKGVPQAEIEYYRDAGHFPMLDTPEQFNQSIRNFLHGTVQPSVAVNLTVRASR
ncbi:MAG: alpha/beta hydrolase [Chloroflexota bacterium]